MSSVAGPRGPAGPRRLRPVPNPPVTQPLDPSNPASTQQTGPASTNPPSSNPASTVTERIGNGRTSNRPTGNRPTGNGPTGSAPAGVDSVGQSGGGGGASPGADAVRRALRRFVAPAPVVLDEGAAPARLAPFAVRLDLEVPANALDYPPLGIALAAADELEDTEEPLATGRFVLLHDPSCPLEWEGAFRVVAFLRASVDASMASDPTLTLVAWDWLVEQLEHHQAAVIAAAGTVTRTASQSFGRLAERLPHDTVEIRASWTIDPRPHGSDLAAIGATADRHIAAFCGLALQAVGLPQL